MDDNLNILEDTKAIRKFLVTIKNKQNGTWQGIVEWIDTGKKQCFRSAWELINLINETIEEKKE